MWEACEMDKGEDGVACDCIWTRSSRSGGFCDQPQTENMTKML